MRGVALVFVLLCPGLCACGPNADDYPLLRPDAGYPEGGLVEEDTDPKNVIESDPLEDWDTEGAGPVSGIYAVELTAHAKVIVELEFRMLLRWRLLQRGAEVQMKSQFCRLGLPTVEGVAELEIPIDLEMLVRSKAQESKGAYLSDPAGLGATFLPPPYLVLLGAELKNPDSDPLPTPDDPSSAVDEDDDGNAGVTLRARTVLCEGEEEAYAALRTSGSIDGVVGDGSIAGATEPRLDQSVLGFSDPCMSAAADLPIEILPGATFSAVRVDEALDIDDNGNVTCGEIVAAAPKLFGGYWAPP